MKKTTRVWIAWNHVGDAKEGIQSKEGEMMDVMKQFMIFLMSNSLKHRIDFALARTQEEAIFGVTRQGRQGQSNPFTKTREMSDAFDALFPNEILTDSGDE